MMNKLVIGILAHVDAGKTTLSESMLYLSGKIRKMGRVDNKDAYLDTFELEKARGITIFSKQAIFEIDDTEITLLDTPGHVDFSAEMERTLQVLDYAILVISGADGVQGHTKTLLRLLEVYQIPTFVFVNKMDQKGTDKDKIMAELKQHLSEGCIDFGEDKKDAFYDQMAMRDETIMVSYLEDGQIEEHQIKKLITERKIFPCFFGSALKLDGIEPFMQGLVQYATIPVYPKEFGAKIFKISRDDQGNRMTHLKVTGGTLKVKAVLSTVEKEEKVNQIRIYSGQKFEAVGEITAGTVCAVTGPIQTKPGEGYGIEESSNAPMLEPVLFYRVILPDGSDPKILLPKLRQIEEEEPELQFIWDEVLQEIQVQIMGEVQIEILKSLIKSRFGVEVAFDAGRIVYKETIAKIVEGVGHFEPLRHYAEVHLLLEPGEQGSGLQFDTNCSEDLLGKNWQRLVLSHLREKPHKGVLTGACITDMKITLVSGRAHNNHTEGGDFREATYRAVRQGLKEAESILLEPYYAFQLEVPEKMVGRAMTDIEKMRGTSEIAQTDGDMTLLVGMAPVATMRNYQQEVVAYTKGLGRLFSTLKGYGPCHNFAEVIESTGYDSERDLENPTGSVFCVHGAGYLVKWDQVKNNMHLEACLQNIDLKEESLEETTQNQPQSMDDKWMSIDEIDNIINNTFFANQGKKSTWKRNKSAHAVHAAHESNYEPTHQLRRPSENRTEYLLVDGYNIIFDWPELKILIEDNMDGARSKLLEILSNYQGIRKCQIIVVFDAYRVEGRREEIISYKNIHMIYTGEAQTADQCIEKFAHQNKEKYRVVVATSDGLQQMIIRGAGAGLLSARELKEVIEIANERIRQDAQQLRNTNRNSLEDTLTEDEKMKLNNIKN